LTGDLGQADLAVLEQWADPRALRLGKAQLTAVIAKASRNHLGCARTEQWLAAARAAVELYADHPAVSFVELAAEVRLIRAIEAELTVHAAERETAYRWADPGQLARALPGLGEVGGPVLAAVIDAVSRFYRLIGAALGRTFGPGYHGAGGSTVGDGRVGERRA
jgi:hypothetical protein